MSRRQRLAWFVTAFVVLAAASAAWGDAPRITRAQRPGWPASAIQLLSQTPTADAQATAAVLAYEADSFDQPSLAQLQQLNEAKALAPQAADIASLAMLWCNGMRAQCDVAASAANLQQLAPGNALGWLPALQTAGQQKRTGSVNHTLQQMAAAGGFSLYTGQWIQRIDSALRNLPPPGTPTPIQANDGGRLWQAAFATQSLLLPDLRPLLAACSRHDPAFSSRRNACQTIANELERSDAYISVAVGLTLQRRTASTADAYRQALAKSLQWRWLLQNAEDHTYAVTRECVTAADHCAHAWDDLAAFVRTEGHRVEPPATWSQRTHYSELLQHDDAKAGVPSQLLVTHDYAAFMKRWCPTLPSDVCVAGCACPTAARTRH